MVLDSLNSETPNIKDLSIESQKTKKFPIFSPERDIDPEVIDGEDGLSETLYIDGSRISVEKKYSDINQFIYNAFCWQIAFPKRIADLNLHTELQEDISTGFTKYHPSTSEFHNASEKICDLGMIKNLSAEIDCDELLESLAFDFGTSVEDMGKSLLQELNNVGSVDNKANCNYFLKEALALRALFPQYSMEIGHFFKSNQEGGSGIQTFLDEIHRYFQEIQFEYLKGSSTPDASDLTSFLIVTIFNKEFAQDVFSEDFIVKLIEKEYPKEVHDTDTKYYKVSTMIAIAAFLKLLTSNQKAVFENGIVKLVDENHENITTMNIPPLPQQRSF